MTLYFKNGKYEIRINYPEIILGFGCRIGGKSKHTQVTITLYKKNFKLFRSCISTLEIILDNSHKYPFPTPVFIGYPKTYIYTDNPKTYKNNLDKYIKYLIDNSSELNVLPENFNYKSYVREERFKKLLDT